MGVWGDKGTQANANELYALARQAGFGVQDAVIATAIALAESSGVTNSWHFNPAPGGEDSYGPWQINRGDKGQFASRGDAEQLVNPQFNARVAFALFQGRGGGWCDWSVYDNGSCGPGHTLAYRGYLLQGMKAAADVSDDQIASIINQLMSRAQQTYAPSPAGTPGAPGQPGLPTGQADPGPAPTPTLPGLPSIPNPLAPFGSALDAIAAPFAWMSVPGHWWAVGFMAIGLAMVFFGLVLYLRPELEQAGKAIAAASA